MELIPKTFLMFGYTLYQIVLEVRDLWDLEALMHYTEHQLFRRSVCIQ